MLNDNNIGWVKKNLEIGNAYYFGKNSAFKNENGVFAKRPLTHARLWADMAPSTTPV